MPPYVPFQCPVPAHGLHEYQGQNHVCRHPALSPLPSSKRQIDDGDDDIQFISEKPVKRHRCNEQRSVIPAHHVPDKAAVAVETPGSEVKNTERRLSTGMVNLPHDISAMELAYALKGVSMPVLENFAFDQPARKPRPLSPPELSPKQLPLTASPSMLNVRDDRAVAGMSSLEKHSDSHTLCASSSHTSCQTETPAMVPDLRNILPNAQQTHALEAFIQLGSCTSPVPFIHPNNDTSSGSNATHMPFPPHDLSPKAFRNAPCWENSNSTMSERHYKHNIPNPSEKHPCQVCIRLRNQTQLSRAQGLPIINSGLAPHVIPQLQCHTAYGQHLPPHMVTMPTSNVHRFGPNFAPVMTPVMTPVSSSGFVSIPTHPQPQHLPQQAASQQQKVIEAGNQSAPGHPNMKKPSQTIKAKVTETSSNTSPKPLHLPASLIQPNYRKRSPNLIVDVAETCQEKFPFEEVAKRHNVTIDKVFDIFAAIIQVPLLRCPKDRRRQGKLATARIKEYNKAKKDIQDSKNSGARAEGAIDSTEIAARLGPVEFPG
ncbi:hypothetical protein F5B22DRAFT_358302 [Xylaria bambusicola]|uniref:uncharacterized protein n=1 Tax=Xylaria bambusicola TaxID=326684 RepID=UPI0020080A53|nr:uncharacterized protein F5B22DRAFT_358302 [Xylaria bambusicola]KAI0509268.1 hypothetical protein F5B22DRAFT_358302 [Xylaria bambusicola]